jgi:hypothetical protein
MGKAVARSRAVGRAAIGDGWDVELRDSDGETANIQTRRPRNDGGFHSFSFLVLVLVLSIGENENEYQNETILRRSSGLASRDFRRGGGRN